MSNAKWTPGPWKTAGEQGVQIRSERHQIAKVWYMRGDEFKFNARLIAAAPELVEALYLALPFVEDAEADQGYKPGFAKRAADSIKKLLNRIEGNA